MNYKTVNVPSGSNVNFDVKINDVNYTIYLKFLENTGCWQIRLKFEKDNEEIDTYYLCLTTGYLFFLAYMNICPVCFFCKTTNGEQPLTKDAFESGKAFLCVANWSDVMEETANSRYENR